MLIATECTTHVARKPHACDAGCGLPIEVGQRYTKQRCWDGPDAWTWKAHHECDVLYRTLNHNCVDEDDVYDLLTHVSENPEDALAAAGREGLREAPSLRKLLAWAQERVEEQRQEGLALMKRHAKDSECLGDWAW